MKFARLLAFGFTIVLFGCQPSLLSTITIIENGKVITLQTDERIPSALLDQAHITLNPDDRLLLNGLPVSLDQPITNPSTRAATPYRAEPQSGRRSPITLQVRRAVTIILITPDGEQKLQSSAFTVGEALQATDYWLRAGDKITPTLDTPLSSSPVTIYHFPSHELTITSNGGTIRVESSAQSVGEALAEAGIPLIGLDYSLPAENDPLPADGQIRVVRVSESVQLAQKPIPFESELQASADVPLDQTQILQPGENGLTVQRIRIRYEDGEEISRVTEEETIVRPPQTRILGYGTKVEVKNAVVEGVNIEYWRAVQMYATSYSPCRSGADKCYPALQAARACKKAWWDSDIACISACRVSSFTFRGMGLLPWKMYAAGARESPGSISALAIMIMKPGIRGSRYIF